MRPALTPCLSLLALPYDALQVAAYHSLVGLAAAATAIATVVATSGEHDLDNVHRVTA